VILTSGRSSIFVPGTTLRLIPTAAVDEPSVDALQERLEAGEQLGKIVLSIPV